jgi:hypothetical protein
MTYGIGYPCPGLGQAQKCGKVKPVNDISTTPSCFRCQSDTHLQNPLVFAN